MYSFWFTVILGGLIVSFTQVNLKIESSLSGLACLAGGYIVSFTRVKLTFPYICLWYLHVYISALVFPYIFLLVDCVEWALIGDIGQRRVDSSALAVSNGGRGIIVSLSALVFPYIFLLVDCFKWALIGNIGQRRVDSVLWQF